MYFIYIYFIYTFLILFRVIHNTFFLEPWELSDNIY